MATGAAVVGGVKLATGIAQGVAGEKAGDRAQDSYDGSKQVITDFLESGEYDPGGSQQTSTSFNESSGGGVGGSTGSSSSSSQSGYNLENAQKLLDEWETTYGGLEDNLSQYYNDLDPEKYAKQYKNNINANIDKELGQVNDELASSGLMSAGMKAQSQKEAAFAKATSGAQADLMAEDKVMGMKTDFLNRGENRKAMYDNALTGVSSSSSSSSDQNSFNTSFNNAIGGSESQGSSTNSNYQPIGDLANIGVKEGNQHAGDSAGWMKGGIDNIGSGIGGLSK